MRQEEDIATKRSRKIPGLTISDWGFNVREQGINLSVHGTIAEKDG